MSSLDIAAITGKPHNDVLEDFRRILEEAEIGLGEFSRSYTDASYPDGSAISSFPATR